MKYCVRCRRCEALPFSRMCMECYLPQTNTRKLLLKADNFPIETFDSVDQLLYYVSVIFWNNEHNNEDDMIKYYKNLYPSLSHGELIEKLFNEYQEKKLTIDIVGYSLTNMGNYNPDFITEIMTENNVTLIPLKTKSVYNNISLQDNRGQRLIVC
jgi:hypothetical protein